MNECNFGTWKTSLMKRATTNGTILNALCDYSFSLIVVSAVIASIWRWFTKTELRWLLEVGDWWKAIGLSTESLIPKSRLLWSTQMVFRHLSTLKYVLKNQIDYSLFKCQSIVLNMGFSEKCNLFHHNYKPTSSVNTLMSSSKAAKCMELNKIQQFP